MKRLFPPIALAILAVGVLIAGVHASDYWTREALAEDLKNQVGEEVKFVDEIISVYEDRQNFPNHFKFDTLHFRCLIPSSDTEAIDLVKEIASERTRGARRTKRLITLEGKVDRTQVYGKVKGDGVVSETIFILVDTAKRPRARYYREMR